MPGPPAGPSLRITTTSPATIRPCVTASIASSSHSKTRARARVMRLLVAGELRSTEPSGARLPRRMARPPVALTGSSTGRTTSWPGVSTASRACSPMVRPVTVGTSSWSIPASSSRLATTRDPPRLVEVLGDEAAARLRSMSSGCAPRSGRSRRCRADAAPVEREQVRTPLGGATPVATAAIAFSRPSRVTMSRGRWPWAITSMISAPASVRDVVLVLVGRGDHRRAHRARAEHLEGHRHRVAGPAAGRADPGEAASSSSWEPSSATFPVAWAPMASTRRSIVTSWPLVVGRGGSQPP